MFEALRNQRLPTLYGEIRTKVGADPALVTTLAIAGALGACLLAAALGSRARCSALIRVGLGLAVGTAIVAAAVGQCWETGRLGDTGVWLGLRGVNVTMGDLSERLSWQWGVRPALRNNLEHAFRRGLPMPILDSMEAFVESRAGRSSVVAGRYGWVLLWASFACWILANILTFLVVRYAAFAMMISGGTQLIAVITWSALRYGAPIAPITIYGWSFWLAVISGLVSVIIALALIILDLRNPDAVAVFFGVPVLRDYEEFYAPSSDTIMLRKRSVSRSLQKAGGTRVPGQRTRQTYDNLGPITEEDSDEIRLAVIQPQPV